MMKTIKVKFVGYWSGFRPENSFFLKLMSDEFDFVISDDADYVICSLFGTPYSYVGEEGKIKIFRSGENYLPDFNLVDYAVCSYPIDYYDRNLYWPECVNSNGHFKQLKNRRTDFSEADLAEKPYFANFIASHDSEHNLRSRFVELLSQYKRVECPGTFMNNMSDTATVSKDDGSKTDFQRKCKFSVCLESTEHYGFITEKISDAFFADTIPIYFGSKNVTDIFNPEAFINVADYPSLEAVAEKVIELDQDNEKYLNMLNQPVLVDPDYYEKLINRTKSFFRNIFNQEYEAAGRTSPLYNTKRHITFLKQATAAYSAGSLDDPSKITSLTDSPYDAAGKHLNALRRLCAVYASQGIKGLISAIRLKLSKSR